jgi:Lrp/AsnC family transcriptional regulator, leucine-responsive regulatory protein
MIPVFKSTMTQENTAPMMESNIAVDAIDRRILDLLVDDGRRSIVDIAHRIQLSPAATKRRIDRLEHSGVIRGYTAILDHRFLGTGFEAFTELRFAGNVEVAAIQQETTAVPEVLEVYTIAGDPDALVRIRVSSVEHLQQVVDALRHRTGVVGTKTLMVLGSWRRGEPRRRAPTRDETA